MFSLVNVPSNHPNHPLTCTFYFKKRCKTDTYDVKRWSVLNGHRPGCCI